MKRQRRKLALLTAAAWAVLSTWTTLAGAETPKTGGILKFVVPDEPPSFDGHRETTFALIHPIAPFYSVLIRVDPENPASATAFVCDLCTEMPKPTDGGKTFTFKIRKGVKFHDGSALTAKDVHASFQHIIFPPEGVSEPAQGTLPDGRERDCSRRRDVRLQAQVSFRRLHAGAGNALQLHLLQGDPRQGPALVREERHGLGALRVRGARGRARRSAASATQTTITPG